MDTPGFSSLYVNDFEKEELKYYFPEFELYEGQCRFNGCDHIHEPGCAVKEAVEKGKEVYKRQAGEAPMAVIGPASPGIGKINDIYRKVIYLKSEDERILMAVKDRMEKYIEINRGFQSLKIQFDMNP